MACFRRFYSTRLSAPISETRQSDRRKRRWKVPVGGAKGAGDALLFSPQGREKAFVDEFLYQTVVVKLFGLRLLRFGIFPAALVQSHLNGFALDQRNFLDEVVGVLHGAFEHARIRDLGVARNNRLRLLFAGMHEMNCFSVSAHKGFNLSPALAQEFTRRR